MFFPLGKTISVLQVWGIKIEENAVLARRFFARRFHPQPAQRAFGSRASDEQATRRFTTLIRQFSLERL